MTILTVAIGMILVYLILSLVSSAVQESIASWLTLRGKFMWRALENMLAEEAGEKSKDHQSLLKKFKTHNRYQSLCSGKDHPSYLKPQTFSKILLHVLNGDDIKSATSSVDELPDGKLKNSLLDALSTAGGDLDKFRYELETWYSEVMDRASGRYKRMAHTNLVVIGLLVACFFNGDSLSIYHKMTVAAGSSEQTQQIIGLAEDLIDSRSDSTFTAKINEVKANRLLAEANADSSLALQLDSILTSQNLDLLRQTDDLVNTYAKANSPLGLGWATTDFPVAEAKPLTILVFWMLKLLGFFVTAMAISLGAPFWFDLLKKFTNIRNAGPKQDENDKSSSTTSLT